jgi:tetratricopeptide (TPR) repeat protein
MNPENQDRNVVPRWRDFHTTVALGELQSSKSSSISFEGTSGELVAKRVSDWRNSRTIWHAADLLNTTFFGEIRPDHAEAAHFILEHSASAPDTLVRLARRLTGEDSLQVVFDSTAASTETIRQQIHFLRGRLRDEGPNAIILTDLARLYASIAKPDAAVRTMLSACKLAPANRFVLRAAARLFLHVKDYNLALRFLRSSPRTAISDPWLTAAEVAVASAVRQPSAFAKDGFRVAKDDSFSHFSRAELNSALATLEMENGNASKARKLFNASLISPNENALAQAEFARRGLGLAIDESKLEVPRSFEANAYFCFNHEMWDDSLSYAEKWLNDQPFSSRPAVFGSYVASCLIEDYDRARNILEQALTANPTNPVLINNLAFAMACSGHATAAQNELKKINWAAVEERYAVSLTATQGLVLMRQGHVEAGRERYQAAISLAHKLNSKQYEIMATAYFAREEALAGQADASKTFEVAVAKAGNAPQPDTKRLLDKVEEVVYGQARRQAL